MKSVYRLISCLALGLFALTFFHMEVSAWDPPNPKTYMLTLRDLEKAKKQFDDPRSTLKEYPIKKVVPKELYEKLVWPIDEMKKEWAEVVGFKAPDVVGKKAPEIKPGKYTYKDLEKNPGFKQLFWPEMYSRIKPGGAPFSGNIPEFEIVPTEQWYHSLPVSRLTKENSPKVKSDDKGYLVWQTWDGGYPYPRPSGPNKALQIMFNVEKRYTSWDGSFVHYTRMWGFRKDLSLDFDGSNIVQHLKLAGRAVIEPYGWLDERAKQKGEQRAFTMTFESPRDYIGMAQSALYYQDSKKADLLMIYVPQLRRIRMMSASDQQDAITGQDLIYDDNDGFLQKISPTRFPYKWEVLEETEYLAPVVDGTEYVTKQGLEIRNMKFARRPIYVVQGTQLDKNYVYSKRIFYIDRETFMFYQIMNYDQKGRLYRSFYGNYSFFPDMGVFTFAGTHGLMKDHIDLHSTLLYIYQLPAFWGRKNVSLEGYIKQK
jgi:hypothetical protein